MIVFSMLVPNLTCLSLNCTYIRLIVSPTYENYPIGLVSYIDIHTHTVMFSSVILNMVKW